MNISLAAIILVYFAWPLQGLNCLAALLPFAFLTKRKITSVIRETCIVNPHIWLNTLFWMTLKKKKWFPKTGQFTWARQLPSAQLSDLVCFFLLFSTELILSQYLVVSSTLQPPSSWYSSSGQLSVSLPMVQLQRGVRELCGNGLECSVLVRHWGPWKSQLENHSQSLLRTAWPADP